MSTSAWTPVDEKTGAWTPVNENQPNVAWRDVPETAQRFENADLQHGTLTNLGIGALKGLGNTTASIGDMIHSIPVIGKRIIPDDGQAAFHAITAPQGTAQRVGYTGEQVAEWLTPTGVEAKVGGLVAAHAPQIAKIAIPHAAQIARVATPAARVAVSALESGLRNKMQGGDFTTGATVGAAGTIAAPFLKKAATGMAEIAMAPGKRVLKSLPAGVDIGKTVLENSTAVSPAKIANQLGEKIAATDYGLSDLYSTAAGNGVTIPLYPARAKIADELQNAVAKNSPDYIKDVGKLGDQLKWEYGADGKPVMKAATPTQKPGAGFSPVQVATPYKMAPVELPDYVDPVRGRSIKQGVDLSIGNWNPEAQSAIAPLQERVRGALAGELNGAVPGSEALNQHLTNLIPAKDAAWNVAHNPGIARGIFEKLAAKTGALTGAVAGYKAGQDSKQPGGALIGGALGLMGGNFITSPAGEMIAARTLAASPYLIPAIKGLGLQIARPPVLLNEDDSAQ